MGRPKAIDPTPAELEILRVLWGSTDCTARDVHDVIARKRKVSVSRINKCMVAMAAKGLLKIVDDRRPAKYSAAKSQEQTYDSMLTRLDSGFISKSPRRLISFMIGRAKMSADDRKKIREQLDRME